MTAIFISPTEPDFYKLHLQAKRSPLPEEHGVDFMWWGMNGVRVGVQRKQFPDDFLASKNDGRLAKELQQMQKLDVRFLLLEGYGSWTIDGELVKEHGQGITQRSFHAMCASIQAVHNSGLYRVRDQHETIEVLKALVKWSEKDKHTSLTVRPGPRKDMWGTRNSKAWALWMLQSIDGVGVGLAEGIYEKFGLPLKWTLESSAELEKVKGIGKAKAEKIWMALA